MVYEKEFFLSLHEIFKEKIKGKQVGVRDCILASRYKTFVFNRGTSEELFFSIFLMHGCLWIDRRGTSCRLERMILGVLPNVFFNKKGISNFLRDKTTTNGKMVPVTRNIKTTIYVNPPLVREFSCTSCPFDFKQIQATPQPGDLLVSFCQKNDYSPIYIEGLVTKLQRNVIAGRETPS